MTSPEQSYDDIRFAVVPTTGSGHYIAGSDGRIFRVREIKPGIGKQGKGYGIVAVFEKNGEKRYRTVHSIIAESFIGPRPEGLTINHIDGNKYNNSASNLEYMTSGDNVRHAHRMGLYSKRSKEEMQRIGGFKKPTMRSLSDEQALLLIATYEAGGVSMKKLGAAFGIPTTTAFNIIRGKLCYKELKR